MKNSKSKTQNSKKNSKSTEAVQSEAPASQTPVATTINKHDKSSLVYRSRKSLVADNFMGGIAWGLGSVIGATVVVAILGFLLARSQELPFVGQIFENVSNQFSGETDSDK